jgi:lipopolysaccharide transport system permease protein
MSAVALIRRRARTLRSRTEGVRTAARAEARLIVSWARRTLHGTYRQSSLRLFWSIFQPLSVFAVYVVVFHWILRVEPDGVPYISFMVVGVTVWRYFAIGLNQATSLVEQSHLLGQVYFRREIVPLSACLSGLIDLGIGTAAIIVVGLFQGIEPTYVWLAMPAVYLILILYTAAAGVFLATVTVFVRDIGHAMPTIQQLLFLATPIMYPPSQLPEELKFLGSLNPIASLADAARDIALHGLWPSRVALLVNAVVAVLLVVGAVAYMRSIEHRIVDIG